MSTWVEDCVNEALSTLARIADALERIAQALESK